MKITFWRITCLSLLFLTIASHAKTTLWTFAESLSITHQRTTVGGTVSGLIGTLVLQNHDIPLTMGSDGVFTFQNTIARGANYNVTVLTQPTTQTCTVTNGSGKMGNGNVTNIAVICSTNA